MGDNEIDGKNESDIDQTESLQAGHTDTIVPSLTVQVDNLADSERAASPPVPGFGQKLRDERIRRGLNTGEVARRLCLSEQLVEAIEAQDFSRLPAAVFLRGYIRNYANLLQLNDTDWLLEAVPLSRLVRTDESLSQRFRAMEPMTRHNRSSRGGWLYIVVILAAFTAYGLYYEDNQKQSESYSLDTRDVAALSDADVEAGSNRMDLALPLPLSELPLIPPVSRDTSSSSTAAILPDQPVLDEDVAKVPNDGKKSLHFSFSRDSWVKVKDSDGQVILEKIHSQGTEQTIEGKPPLYLVIGNAAGVNLTYNGYKVDLAPYTRGSDDVARFSLE